MPGTQQTPWAHHGLAALTDGRIVTFTPGNNVMRIVDPDGRLLAEHATELVTAHGVTPAVEDGRELLWIADTVSAPRPDPDGGYSPWYGPGHGRVLALGLDGSIERELELPPLPVYESQRFEPTAVLPLPGFGQVWVSDGYGAGLVHRYSTGGDYLGIAPASRDGAFSCPHAMVQDGGRVIVADRENDRLVTLDPEGQLIGTFADGLRRPSCLAFREETLVVGELSASVALLDRDGRLMGRHGTDATAVERPGWPNALSHGGATIAPQVPAERFNSPHAVAVDAAGRIHVVEWLVGGRHVRFNPDGAGPATVLWPTAPADPGLPPSEAAAPPVPSDRGRVGSGRAGRGRPWHHQHADF
ncbi:hypothetical protein OH809_05120 [Streptomyces sp. NBC_00873]|uniref:hypothetical protein n=1 Tax=Streptomyces sp. NBC_00873 TaxID=2975852 RepID=UPI00386CCFF9|nr:hypothetical protein OH809_05120 [Streptomyces sp. NBC_00873]